ncbi:hypothetical protein GCM10027162_04210 [Streptomyces incanus]
MSAAAGINGPLFFVHGDMVTVVERPRSSMTNGAAQLSSRRLRAYTPTRVPEYAPDVTSGSLLRLLVLVGGPPVAAVRGRRGVLPGYRAAVLAVPGGGLPAVGGLWLVGARIVHRKELTP